MKNGINIKTVDQLLEQAAFRDSFKVLPKGDTFKDLSTIIIIPTPGAVTEKRKLNCKKCKTLNEYEHTSVMGLNPVIVESWKRLVKPMNVPILEMMVNGYEVGDAYNKAIEMILANPALNNFKYILTLEHDNIIPFIPNTQGPLMMLYEDIEKGFDVAGGLYWTKGNPSMPLIYGDIKEKRENNPAGYFKVRMDWKEGDIVECNGMGMGFTLFKLELFKDKRLKKPWFKTCNDHTPKGPRLYTQDLYFFEQFRKLGYRCAVDTRVKLGHMDLKSGIIY